MYDDGLPILLAYQSAWNDEPGEIAVCEKSRRIGLSWADAAERAIHAAEGKGNVYYMSYNKDMTEGYINDCADWARRLGHAVGEVLEETVLVDDKEVQRFRINFDSGKSIIALNSNPRVLRSKGKPGDIVIIDEAAFCDDLDELLKAAVAVTQWGGKVRIISTHNGDENPFNELVTDIRAGRQDYALHRIDIDDALGRGLARRICTVKGDAWSAGYAGAWRAAQYRKYRSSDAADEELGCIPRHGAGAYLPRILIESCMVDVPVIRFTGTAAFNALTEPERRVEMADWLDAHLAVLLGELDPERRHVIGGDFARTGDLSVYAPLEVGAALVRRSPFLLEMRNVPHMQQVQAVEYICDRLPRFGAGAFDATGNGSFLAEAVHDRYGPIIDQVMLTDAWYRDHMPPYKAAFQDATIAIPRSDDVVEDHRAIQLVNGVPKLPKGKTASSDGQRHGDAAMALCLAYAASRADTPPAAGATVGGDHADTYAPRALAGRSRVSMFGRPNLRRAA